MPSKPTEVKKLNENGITIIYANIKPQRKDKNVKIIRGIIYFFSSMYKPGATNFQIWKVRTGIDIIIPPKSAILHLIINIPWTFNT